MRCAVLHTPGQPPTFTERPAPDVREGRSLVRVTAAPLVPLDLLCASGTSYFGRPPTSYVPGVQGVGIVERSDHVVPGTRVWFSTRAGMAPGDGSLAELCAVEDDDLVAMDAGVPAVPDALVAALGLSAVAAWMALTWRGGLRAGERVLVLGGGGAVGQAAIGISRAQGAALVVALARSPEAQQRALDAGAHVVLAMDPDVAVLTARLATACDDGFDLVLDPVFGVAATAAARMLAEGGRLVNLGGASGDEATFSSAVLRSRSLAVLGYTNNAITVEQRRDAVLRTLHLAADGQVRVAHRLQPLAAVEEVWRRQTAGGDSTRTVLVP